MPSVLGPILFVAYAADLFDVIKNQLVNYTDDPTVFATVDKPSSRQSVAIFLNRNLASISD